MPPAQGCDEERPLSVFGYILSEESDEVEIALLYKGIVEYCSVNDLRLAMVYHDRGLGDDTTARTHFLELVRLLADEDAYDIVVPTLDHLSQWELVRSVLTRMIEATGSKLLVVDEPAINTSGAVRGIRG